MIVIIPKVHLFFYQLILMHHHVFLFRLNPRLTFIQQLFFKNDVSCVCYKMYMQNVSFDPSVTSSLPAWRPTRWLITRSILVITITFRKLVILHPILVHLFPCGILPS